MINLFAVSVKKKFIKNCNERVIFEEIIKEKSSLKGLVYQVFCDFFRASSIRYGEYLSRQSFSNTYMIRIVLVNPEPCFHPVTMQTGSPVFKKPRVFPKSTPYLTRTSTSFSQSSKAASVKEIFYKSYWTFKYLSVLPL